MKKLLGLAFLMSANFAHAADLSTTLYVTDNEKTILGTVIFSDSPNGLLIIPNLTKLPQGNHGFHLHEKPDCAGAGMAAGGHYDPEKTKSHQGPYAQGHLGDLPVLAVTKNGTASTPILAPRLKTSDLKGLALMIHSGGDTYSDQPPLGGGGARLGCGVIK